MSDPEKTDSKWQTKLHDWTKKADPYADGLLNRATRSSGTVWIVVGLVLFCIVFGAWVATR